MTTIQYIGLGVAVVAFLYMLISKFGWEGILNFFKRSSPEPDDDDEDVITLQVTGSDLFISTKLLIAYFQETKNMEGEMAARTVGQCLFSDPNPASGTTP